MATIEQERPLSPDEIRLVIYAACDSIDNGVLSREELSELLDKNYDLETKTAVENFLKSRDQNHNSG
jgi:hypothetical protein